MTMLIRVFDLETTGFSPETGAVCEVAFVNLVADGSDLPGAPRDWRVEPGVSNWLCDPGHPIPPETSAIHHIVDEDVRGREGFEAISHDIFSHSRACVVALAAHNARFERQWLTDAVTGGAPWVCTYKCALRLWPDAPGHSNQALRYWLKPDGLDRRIADRAHRAGPDAYVTAFLLREMLALASLAQLVEWSDQPALQSRCRIGKWRGRRWSEVDDGFLRWVASRDFDEDVLFTVRHEIDRREREAAIDADDRLERTRALGDDDGGRPF